MAEEKSKVIAENRKARHDYFVIEALETGIELVGTEVKSVRTGEVNLKDAWVEVENGELYPRSDGLYWIRATDAQVRVTWGMTP